MSGSICSPTADTCQTMAFHFFFKAASVYILCKYRILWVLLFSLRAPHTSSQPRCFLLPLFLEMCLAVWERRRSCATKLTFAGVWPPPVILSTPSLCGAQPSETTDRRTEGGVVNTLLPHCPVQRCDVLTHTARRREAHVFLKTLIASPLPAGLKAKGKLC